MSNSEKFAVVRYIPIQEVARRYGVSVGCLHKLTSASAIPFTRRAGIRRLMFREDHLDLWDDGAKLEVVHLPGGGKLVRPTVWLDDENEIAA